jgi:hypothetical protein
MKWFRFNRDLEGAGGGGTENAPPPGPALVEAAREAAKTAEQQAAGGQQQATQQQQGQQEQQAEVYFPKGLPDTLRGATERETLDKIAADFEGRPKPPEKPDGYELKLPDALKERFGDMKDDPVLPLWREVAHELGLDNTKFNGAFEKLYTKMAEKGLVDDPVNISKEMQSLGGTTGDVKQREAAGAQRLNSVLTSVTALATRGVLTTAEAYAVQEAAATANGVIALEKLLKLRAPPGIQADGEGGGPSLDLNDPSVQARLMYPNSQKK